MVDYIHLLEPSVKAELLVWATNGRDAGRQ
jgi:hypothetical protein